MATNFHSVSRVAVIGLLVVITGCSDDSGRNTQPGGSSSGGTSNSSSSTSSSSTSSASSSSASSTSSGTMGSPSGFSVNRYTPGDDLGAQIALVSTIQVEYSQNVMAGSFGNNLITVTANSAAVNGTLSFNGGRVLEFTPANLLPPDSLIDVTVSSNIMSVDGQSGTAESWQFMTTGDVYRTSQAVIDQCMDVRDIEMLAAVNALRTAGYTCHTDGIAEVKPPVGKLNYHCLLDLAATGHSEDMVQNQYFSHYDSNGLDPGDRITNVGYDWRAYGENIAAGNPDVTRTMEQWKTSETGHCDALMADYFTEFGLGYDENLQDPQRYRYYWTQNFATPW